MYSLILIDCLRTVISNTEDVNRWIEIPDLVLLEHLKDDIDAFLRRSLSPLGTNYASVIHVVEHWLDRGIVNTEMWEPDVLNGFCISLAWDLASLFYTPTADRDSDGMASLARRMWPHQPRLHYALLTEWSRRRWDGRWKEDTIRISYSEAWLTVCIWLYTAGHFK